MLARIKQWFIRPEPQPPDLDGIQGFIDMLRNQTKHHRKCHLEFAKEHEKKGEWAQCNEYHNLVFKSDTCEEIRNIKDFLFKVAVKLKMKDEYEAIITKQAPGYEEPKE